MPDRVVSLLASATEILCSLGFEHVLVARSHECDYPETVKRLPAITHPKLKVNVGSAQIDREIKTLLEQGLSIYQVDARQLKELNPTLIITQTQCEVCAVSLKDVEQALCEWVRLKDGEPKIVSLCPNSLADVWADIARVAAALNASERSVVIISRLKARMKTIADQARSLGPKPRVASIEWIDPLMAGGNWMPELIEMAGGVNLFGEAGKHSPWMSWDELKTQDPDIIVIVPCGYDIAKTRQELPALTQKPDWPKLKAVKNNRVYLADGNQYFNRPGPRLAESLEILSEILHPGQFRFGHQNTGWRHL
ncbi:MAG: cobalamin-binding protein [Elusimicrobia bacterium]|nr:cobalamin-binding protein [Elusimicrobiota bacterium]